MTFSAVLGSNVMIWSPAFTLDPVCFQVIHIYAFKMIWCHKYLHTQLIRFRMMTLKLFCIVCASNKLHIEVHIYIYKFISVSVIIKKNIKVSLPALNTNSWLLLLGTFSVINTSTEESHKCWKWDIILPHIPGASHKNIWLIILKYRI